MLVRISILLLSASPVWAGELYRDYNRHFQIQIPDGWILAPASELETINAFTQSMTEGGTSNTKRYFAVFRPKQNATFELPYIMLQESDSPAPSTTYDQLERSLQQEMNAPMTEELKTLKSNGLDGTLQERILFLDRAQNCFLMRIAVKTEDESMFLYSTGHLGSSKTIIVHSGIETDEFEATKARIDAANATFAFDPGYSFRANTPFAGNSAGPLANFIARYGLVILLGLFMARFLRGKARN